MAKFNRKIGFIGAGNMAEAFIGAITKSGIIASSKVFASDVSEERLDSLKKNYGISVINDNSKVFSMSDIVILAVKPQQVSAALTLIANREDYCLQGRKLIISIAAGITLEKLESILYAPLNKENIINLPIIRVMPNTPALVLAGMSGMVPNRYANPDDINIVRTILEAMGKVIEFKEDALNAVTALSGSGPAYVFYLVESMIQGGINLGLDPYDATILTIATLKGSVALLEEIDESPELLRKRVTSPGGTTEEAFKVLEKKKVKEIIAEAIAAAARRSGELSR
ncbi:MAG: pyrroline-5-carboxylate reductase [Proteobacteria bacterium]|nr:pyrroline-5-carboxylate reductase [Pseudomonadota bacterium]MBU4009407.1 pyrroline-5-carboxylate reductase [Pseudomonadota bacterium]MBU4037906.1 pyrroline-5-carboxylate reductase [Pseudomonadota bacterium]